MIGLSLFLSHAIDSTDLKTHLLKFAFSPVCDVRADVHNAFCVDESAFMRVLTYAGGFVL